MKKGSGREAKAERKRVRKKLEKKSTASRWRRSESEAHLSRIETGEKQNRKIREFFRNHSVSFSGIAKAN